MAEYAIRFSRSARKELERLDNTIAARVFTQIEALAINPRPVGCRKIQGADDLWRIRIGHYRVIYRIVEQEVIVKIVAVRHRRDAYRF
ncbi:MAG: type II toxin-antitoxin system RelE/ParE family toxin [Anaerolineales bacterium]|nr:type II toxin-antitoxin system RelE/ParE family toxin [Anaerolineales bacterium]